MIVISAYIIIEIIENCGQIDADIDEIDINNDYVNLFCNQADVTLIEGY